MKRSIKSRRWPFGAAASTAWPLILAACSGGDTAPVGIALAPHDPIGLETPVSPAPVTPALGSGTQPSPAGAEGMGSDPAAGMATPEQAFANSCLSGTVDPGPSVMRRLTHREFNNTVRDLLGDQTAPADSWLAEPGDTSFDNDGTAQVLTRQHVEQFRITATAVAERAVQTRLEQIAPCANIVRGAAACADAFIQSFGRRMFRRPIAAEEADVLKRVYAQGERTGGYEHGVELVLRALLQSVHFLYLPEVGSGALAESGPQRLSGWELASRLSYYLWGSAPDVSLLDAAASGALDTDDGVRRHAERLLDHPNARRSIEHFYEQWLRIEGLPDARRSPERFPDFDASVAESMMSGTKRFVAETSLNGTFGELMMGDTFYVDENTAPLYGVDMPAAAEGQLVPIAAPNGQRAGLLTDVGVLAGHSGFAGHSPIARGVFIRENVMCSPPPPPPDDLVFENPENGPSLTTRERFELHRASPACAICHALFDPIGFGFENYDALGRFRTEENGVAVDARGEVVAYDGQSQEFDGPLEFARILANSPEAKQCFVRQWFRFSNGRLESEADGCSLAELSSGFATSGFSIRELLISHALSDAFLYRRPLAQLPVPSECQP